MMKKLWVDDLRNPVEHVEGEWTWAKNSNEAFRELSSNTYEVVSLDNDLGEDTEGKDIFNWIEQRLHWRDIELSRLKTIYIHSSNGEAVRYMLGARVNFKERYGIAVRVIGSSITKS